MKSLLDLGFQFEPTEQKKPSTNSTFESRCNELRVFKELHGHTAVDRNQNKSLYQWIARVKTSYNRAQEGRTPAFKLTPEKIHKLEELGLKFGSKRKTSYEYVESTQKMQKRRHITREPDWAYLPTNYILKQF